MSNRVVIKESFLALQERYEKLKAENAKLTQQNEIMKKALGLLRSNVERFTFYDGRELKDSYEVFKVALKECEGVD